MGLDIESCKTNDSRIVELKKFLNKYPENILLKVDKAPDLIYVPKSDYYEKIEEFLGKNFEKIPNYTSIKFEKDLEKFRLLISKTFKNSVPKDVLTDMHPSYSISDFYGMYKCHKDGEPIRGIVTSYNSIVCNAKNFLKDILEPIASECSYTVESLKEFQTKFINEKIKFDQHEHKVVSVDVTNMYNNVNIPSVVSFILEKII